MRLQRLKHGRNHKRLLDPSGHLHGLELAAHPLRHDDVIGKDGVAARVRHNGDHFLFEVVALADRSEGIFARKVPQRRQEVDVALRVRLALWGELAPQSAHLHLEAVARCGAVLHRKGFRGQLELPRLGGEVSDLQQLGGFLEHFLVTEAVLCPFVSLARAIAVKVHECPLEAIIVAEGPILARRQLPKRRRPARTSVADHSCAQKSVHIPHQPAQPKRQEERSGSSTQSAAHASRFAVGLSVKLLCRVFRLLGFGFWVFGFLGFWVSGFGFWVLGFGRATSSPAPERSGPSAEDSVRFRQSEAAMSLVQAFKQR
eukprot:scaffold1878_cov258-Pinguiococcus_pyrenoidosus.AAC.29